MLYDSMTSTPNFHIMRGQMLALEALRFLIAWWVVFCHHYLGQEEIESSYMKNLVYNNQGSVYAFVVISGFVTHWTSRDIQFSSVQTIANYLKRRYLRIYLAYGLAVFFAFIMRFPKVSQTHVSVSTHLFNTTMTALGLQSWFTWTENGVYTGPAFSLAAPFWTISSLIFCWAMYPLFARFFVHRGSISVAVRDTVLILLLGVVHRLLRPGNIDNPCSGWGPYQGWHWFPPNILGLFLLGVYGAELAASLQCYREKISSSTICAISIDLLFLLYFVLNMTNWDVDYLGLHYSLDCFARTVPILIGLILCTMTESFLFGSKFMFPLQYLAKYALAIYVFQTPLAQLFQGTMTGFPVVQWPHFALVTFYAYFACLLALSMVYYNVLEERCFPRKPKQDKTARRSMWALPLSSTEDMEATHKYMV